MIKHLVNIKTKCYTFYHVCGRLDLYPGELFSLSPCTGRVTIRFAINAVRPSIETRKSTFGNEGVTIV